MGSDKVIPMAVFQECGAFFLWDLGCREHVNVTYSYIDSTLFALDLLQLWVAIWFYVGIKK
jgi:hypothetical protein